MNQTHTADQKVLDNETLTQMLESHARSLEPAGQDGQGREGQEREGQEAQLSLFIISDFDFSGLSLYDIHHIYNTTFHRCRFQRTDCYGVVFDEIAAPAADFREAVLAKAEFYDADLRDANFDSANPIRVFFLNCDLRGATFRGADLSCASFSGSELEGAVFDQPINND